MNKKITRRVVLGTAIAGLSAGPYAIRALMNRGTDIAFPDINNVGMTSKRLLLFKNWTALLSETSVRMTQISESEQIRWDWGVNFEEPKEFSLVECGANINGSVSSLGQCNEDNLLSVERIRGRISIVPSQAGQLVFSIQENLTQSVVVDRQASEANGVVFGTDGTVSSNSGKSKIYKVADELGQMGVLFLDKLDNVLVLKTGADGAPIQPRDWKTVLSKDHFKLLAFYDMVVPPQSLDTIVPGNTYSVTEDMTFSVFPNRFYCECSVLVDEFQTIKLVFRRALNSKECAEYTRKRARILSQHQIGTLEEYELFAAEIERLDVSEHTNIVLFVDMSSGLIVRKEMSFWQESVDESVNNNLTSFFSISQLFKS